MLNIPNILPLVVNTSLREKTFKPEQRRLPGTDCTLSLQAAKNPPGCQKPECVQNPARAGGKRASPLQRSCRGLARLHTVREKRTPDSGRALCHCGRTTKP